MNVLIACEESQVVCSAFRAKGHNAFSCDIVECSGGHPEWHIQDDVLKMLHEKLSGVLKGNRCSKQTIDKLLEVTGLPYEVAFKVEADNDR